MGGVTSALASRKCPPIPRRFGLTLEDIFDICCYLDRDSLDCLLLTSQSLALVVDTFFEELCLRPISFALVQSVASADDFSDSGSASIYIATVGLPTLMNGKEQVSFTHHDCRQVIEWLLLRAKHVVVFGPLKIFAIPAYWEICSLFQRHGKKIWIAGELRLRDFNASPTLLHTFITSTFARVNCLRLDEYGYASRYRSSHISNAFLEKYIASGVFRVFLPSETPRFEDFYNVQDAGILNLVLALLL